MAVQTFYRPQRDDQLKTSGGAINCGACMTRVLIRRWSLGGMNPTIAAIRKGAQNLYRQFDIYDVAQALGYFGIRVHAVYDRFDNFSAADLAAWLKAGNYAGCLGDYDEVPIPYSGDPSFNGNHFTMANNWQSAGPLMYDPVSDGRRAGIPTSPLTWPWYILNRYLHGLSDKLDYDVTVVLIKRRTVKRKLDEVPVYALPDKATQIGNWHTGPLEYGGVFRGVAQGDPPNPLWYRVWWPYTARIGYVSMAHVTINS